MLRADDVKVEWDRQKKCWEIRIQVGAEVIKRPLPGQTHKSMDLPLDTLKAQAVAIGKDEGYLIDPAQVSVVQNQ